MGENSGRIYNSNYSCTYELDNFSFWTLKLLQSLIFVRDLGFFDPKIQIKKKKNLQKFFSWYASKTY